MMWNPSHNDKIPVGVLEADASLLEFVCVLEFGDFLGVDGRFGHGLLELEQRCKSFFSRMNSCVEVKLTIGS